MRVKEFFLKQKLVACCHKSNDDDRIVLTVDRVLYLVCCPIDELNRGLIGDKFEFLVYESKDEDDCNRIRWQKSD